MFSDLRKKDDSFKKKVAIFFAGFFSMGLLMVWVQQNFLETRVVAIETKEKSGALIDKFSAQMGSAFSGLKSIFGEMKDVSTYIVTNIDALNEEKKSDTISSVSTTSPGSTPSQN